MGGVTAGEWWGLDPRPGSQTRRLLNDIGRAIEPAETHLATLDDLTDLATDTAAVVPMSALVSGLRGEEAWIRPP